VGFFSNKKPLEIAWQDCLAVKFKGQGHQTQPYLKGHIYVYHTFVLYTV